MTIDKLYINEAIRIRTEYIKNLKYISNKESIIKNIISNMEALKGEIEDTDELNEDEYKSKLMELGEIMSRIESDILPHHKAIESLNKDQQKLYHTIKDKYDDISDDEIQKQIMPHIVELDKNLRK